MCQPFNLQHKNCLKALFIALLAGSLFACGGSGNPPTNTGDDNDPDPAPINVELDFMVQTHDGARLSDVTVTLDESSVESDAAGHAGFSVPGGESYVVRAEAEGFITQALKIEADEDSIMPIRLTPVKQTLNLDDIESPRTLSATDLGARISFPADAFVTPDGEPASGSATVQVTPWDISNGELNAMPGNGQAEDAMGQAAELISAGMITVDVRNENGDYLQLADNTTATIQMDLPQASINNQVLSIGDTIPMWHFDESLGVWVEDDTTTGTVVASATSPVGLAVRAEVGHFSTWNWDFKFDNGGSINVECRLQDDSAVPCGISAEVTLDDGSMFTRSGQLPAGGSTIINMPVSATINWHATASNGLLGTQTTDMSSDVVIELGDPSSNNFVRCLLPDGSAVSCQASLTDGTNTLTQTIPAEGATIVTPWPNLDETTQLTWTAETPYPVNFDGQQVTAEGSVSSGIDGNVDIALTTTPIEEVTVECLSSIGTTIPCSVSLVATLSDGDEFTEANVAVNDSQNIAIPSNATLIQWSAESAGAFSQNGQFVALSGAMETALISSVAIILDEETVVGTAAQSIQLRCVNGQDTAATTCDIEAFLESNRTGFISLGSFESVPVDEVVTLEFPDGMAIEGDWVQMTANGDDGSAGSTFTGYETLTDGESVDLELACSGTPDGAACL